MPWWRHLCKSHCQKWHWAGRCIPETAQYYWWELPVHPQTSAEDKCRPAKATTQFSTKLQKKKKIKCTTVDVQSSAVVYKGFYLDSVLRIVATPVHIKTSVHAAAEVPPLRDGAGDGQADQGGVVNAALVQSPVSCRLDGVRPELKHPCGNKSQQHHRKEGDVVYPVLGFHPRDESGAPGAVFPSRVHAWHRLVLPNCEVRV